MTAKEYLEQLTDMQKRIQSLRRRRTRCKERGNDIAVHYGNGTGSGGGSPSKVAKAAEEAADIDTLCRDLALRFDKFSAQVIYQINKVPNNLYASLLMDKYVDGMSWQMIASSLGKEETYVRKELHSKALRSFEEHNPQSEWKKAL